MKNLLFIDKGQDEHDRKRQDKFYCFYPAHPAAEGDPPAKRILFFFQAIYPAIALSIVRNS